MDTQDSVHDLRFYWQASSPRFEAVLDPRIDTIGEAIETVFIFLTERALLNWNGCRVSLCYKYDLSVIIDDVLDMLEALIEPSGQWTATWSSDTFNGQWKLVWDSEIVDLEADWDDVGGGALEGLKQVEKTVRITKQHFLCEWGRPLRIVHKALTDSGYDPLKVEGFTRLTNILSCITGDGILYRNLGSDPSSTVRTEK